MVKLSAICPDVGTFSNGLIKSIDIGVFKTDDALSTRNLLTSESQTLSGQPACVVGYDYDADGLRNGVTYPSAQTTGYAWTSRAQLQSVSADGPPPAATRSYDTAGRLTGVSNDGSSGSLDTTSYVLTADGRRDTATRNGSIDDYGYDNARQVTSAAIPLTSGTHNNNYAYDLAGNRSSATTNGATATYLANSVNAYYSISGGGFQPPSPVYDANGNATTYPVKPLGSSSLASCVFSWDINNQQISAIVGPDSATYQYDALGRRTQRRETIAGVTTDTWFLTNGWNVELEHDGSDYTKRQTWGLDLSNTLQGAGGVGGLVMVETLPAGGAAPVPHFPTYDGNGNITAWVNASGTVIARQRYDAYGNIVEQTGTAPSNYGFSTKPQEKLTGFLYYGYRYYDPLTGRWPSRDPIEEAGGVNLYGFVGNDPIINTDLLGQVDCCYNCSANLVSEIKTGEAGYPYKESHTKFGKTVCKYIIDKCVKSDCKEGEVPFKKGESTNFTIDNGQRCELTKDFRNF